MADKADPELTQLKKIREELEDIRANTSTRGWFWRGILYGAGAILGSLLMVLLIGWVLSIMGIIPEFGVLSQDINSAFGHVRY